MLDYNDLVIEKLKLAGNVNRKSICEEILDYYEGEQASHLKKYEGETDVEFETRKPELVTMNFTAHVAAARAKLFLAPRTCVIEAKGTGAKAAAVVANEMNDPIYRVDMKKVDKMTDLLGDMFIAAYWDDMAKTVRRTIWYPQYIDVVQTEEDPTKEDAIITSSWLEATSKTVAQAALVAAPDAQIVSVRSVNPNVTRQVIYTRDYIKKFLGGKPVAHADPMMANDANPYGVIPFIHLQNERNWRQYWCKGIGDELVEINRAINYRLSDLAQLVKYQVFSVLVITGTEQKSVKIGPKAFIGIPDAQGSASYISPNADVEKLILAIDKWIRYAYKLAGIQSSDPTNLSIDVSSGVAIMMGHIEALEYREDRAIMFREKETELARLMLRIYCAHTGVEYRQDDYTITLDYGKPTLPIPSSEKLAEDQFKLDNRIINRVDLWLRDNPGKDRDDAKAALALIDKEDAEIKSIAGVQMAEAERANPMRPPSRFTRIE